MHAIITITNITGKALRRGQAVHKGAKANALHQAGDVNAVCLFLFDSF